MKTIRIALLALILTVGAFLGSGCGSVKSRLVPGGAYNPVTTNAAGVVLYRPDPAYFLADLSFKTTWNTLDAAFSFEKDNRVFLDPLFPKLHSQMNVARAKATRIWLNYAKARVEYLKVPTASNLNQLQLQLTQLKAVLKSISPAFEEAKQKVIK